MKYLKIFSIVSFGILFCLPQVNAQKETPPAPKAPKDFVLPAKKQITLGNGMRATLVQYGQVPKVTVLLSLKTGEINENAHQVWLSDVLARMMEQGTETMNAGQLQRKIAEMGGSIGIHSGSYQFSVSASALSENVIDLIKLISDLVMHPAFPESQLNRIKNDFKRNLAVQKEEPQLMAQAKFSEIIYGNNSPYGRMFPTNEMLDDYTLGDVKKFYEENFGAKRAVLYVAGVFNEGEVSKAIEAAFKGWKQGSGATYPDDNFKYKPQTAIINRKGAPQTTVFMGLPVIDPKNPDYMKLTIANSLLGGSFGSRITRNIREDKGYTYSPFSTINNMPGISVWYEDADITSEHTIDAISEIKKEILRLADTIPSQQEMLGIQRNEAGLYILKNSSPDNIIGQLNFMDHFGLSDSYLSDMVKNIYAVTPEEVSAMVKKYIDPDKMSLVMVGDEEQIKAQDKEK